MSKKILSLLLVLLMLFLTACGSGSVPESNQTLPDNNQTASEDVTDQEPNAEAQEDYEEYIDYYFKSEKLLNQHYEKHGIDMGFDSAEEYEKAASDVINNPDALWKTEKEDGDYVFYVEDTNEFVVLSTEGYIRTYFLPDAGKKYYDKQ